MSFSSRLLLHEKKVNYTQKEFYLYRFNDTEPVAKQPLIVSEHLPVLSALTTDQSVFKETFVIHLKNNWDKFIQYNGQQFCLLETVKEKSIINFRYCNNKLFQRSLELSLVNISTVNFFSTIEADFIFKINSHELKELLDEKNSFYSNNIDISS
jgi:hypothetical protein